MIAHSRWSLVHGACRLNSHSWSGRSTSPAKEGTARNMAGLAQVCKAMGNTCFPVYLPVSAIVM